MGEGNLQGKSGNKGVSLSPPLLVSPSMNMEILSQFLLRLAFGLAFGMVITSPQKVSSGFFRNHLYVTLGLATLATLVLVQLSEPAAWFAGAAALASFFGAAFWLYEARWAGWISLLLVAACSMAAALQSASASPGSDVPTALRTIAVLTSGLLLGVTTGAMLLGHWYLNAPGMELGPLRRLLSVAMLSAGIQALVSGAGLIGELSLRSQLSPTWLPFVLLRWSFGLCGVVVLLWMARQTLKIPNTQSATGILYVAVIGVFVGELTAALLSAESTFPL
jgi:hypothetical protein